MARTKKERNYDQEIKELDIRIGKQEASLKKLREERKELVSEQERDELRMFKKALKEQGITFEQAIQSLKKED